MLIKDCTEVMSAMCITVGAAKLEKLGELISFDWIEGFFPNNENC
jgi:hypothetical protein